MKIKVITAFSFAHDGINIEHYEEGVQSVCKRCAEIALQEGWAEKIQNKIQNKTKKG